MWSEFNYYAVSPHWIWYSESVVGYKADDNDCGKVLLSRRWCWVLHKVVQVRLYPSQEQEIQLAQTFGCARWWWNYALNKSIETDKETGKRLGRAALNAFLPTLKKAEDTIWLADCYSQVLQATTLNLTTAYKNFFEKRAGFPKFKAKSGKQSIQYPQNVKIVDGNVKIPGNIGIVKAKIHRPIEGKIKTVTISKTPSGKYFASILTEVEGENPTLSEGKIYGIDLGLKHFAVVTDCGWGTFTNFLAYKLERKGGKLVEIDRWFPSSKLCSNCFYQVSEMPLDVREWTCPDCGTHHDRDGNAAINIRAEGIRTIKTEGSAVSAVGGDIRPKLGRKSKLRHSPVSTEADTVLGYPNQCG